MSQLLKFKKIKRETAGKHNQNTKKNRRETKKNKEKHREIGLTINVAYSVCLKGTPNQNTLKWVLYSHLFLHFSAVSQPFLFCFFLFWSCVSLLLSFCLSFIVLITFTDEHLIMFQYGCLPSIFEMIRNRQTCTF